jgi:hypothetical protein
MGESEIRQEGNKTTSLEEHLEIKNLELRL